MPRARSNGIELEYESIGDPASPAMLLVMGLSAQLIDWPPEFCAQLVAHGFRVIRFDNRDAGLSTSLDDLGTPDLAAVAAGRPESAPYLLADLANDAVGLLDALGVDRAHWVGASMGAMIAQQAAIDHPERLLSLCSIMSTTGDPSVGRASPQALATLGQPRGTRDEVIESTIRASRLIGSTGFEVTDEERRRRAEAKYDRAYRPVGRLRQYAAVVASPDRTAGLRAVTVPTVVIHGDVDPLIDVSGGRATAAAIPGADLEVIAGMGHDLPRGATARVVEAVVRNARKADGAAGRPQAAPIDSPALGAT